MPAHATEPGARPPTRAKNRLTQLVVAFSMLMPLGAFADTLAPSSFEAVLRQGETTTLTRTVTISPILETGIVDIFFLADSTASMGTAISSVRTGAAGIMAATVGLGDVRWGVGEYRDVNYSNPGAFVYRTNQDLTDQRDLVQAGINHWATSAGGDRPEANLFALQQVASTISWRPGSTRILAWFGDAPGHDPSMFIYTEASATAALKAANVKVEAIDVGFAGTVQSLDYQGQATRIATATGGHVFSGVDSALVATAIENAIGVAVSNYSRVCIDAGEAPAGISAAVSNCITGSFNRRQERSFDFTVAYTGDVVGSYAFNLYASVDGGRVATATDRLTVTAVPEPQSYAMLLSGFLILGTVVHRRRYARATRKA